MIKRLPAFLFWHGATNGAAFLWLIYEVPGFFPVFRECVPTAIFQDGNDTGELLTAGFFRFHIGRTAGALLFRPAWTADFLDQGQLLIKNLFQKRGVDDRLVDGPVDGKKRIRIIGGRDDPLQFFSLRIQDMRERRLCQSDGFQQILARHRLRMRWLRLTRAAKLGPPHAVHRNTFQQIGVAAVFGGQNEQAVCAVPFRIAGKDRRIHIEVFWNAAFPQNRSVFGTALNHLLVFFGRAAKIILSRGERAAEWMSFLDTAGYQAFSIPDRHPSQPDCRGHKQTFLLLVITDAGDDADSRSGFPISQPDKIHFMKVFIQFKQDGRASVIGGPKTTCAGIIAQTCVTPAGRKKFRRMETGIQSGDLRRSLSG